MSIRKSKELSGQLENVTLGERRAFLFFSFGYLRV